MKKWLASFMMISLVLAACGNTGDDEKTKKDEPSSKTEEKQSNDHSKSKDNKDKATTEDSKSNEKNDQSNATSDNTNENNTNSNGTHNTQNSDNASSQQAENNPGANGSNPGTNGPNQGSKYVPPYQGQNVVPVAQNLARNPVDQQQALKQLPNFQTSLDAAQREATSLNGQQNPYNDYAIQGEGGSYRYIFSFLNQSQPGTYMIVTVDQLGNSKIVDPAYRQ